MLYGLVQGLIQCGMHRDDLACVGVDVMQIQFAVKRLIRRENDVCLIAQLGITGGDRTVFGIGRPTRRPQLIIEDHLIRAGIRRVGGRGNLRPATGRVEVIEKSHAKRDECDSHQHNDENIPLARGLFVQLNALDRAYARVGVGVSAASAHNRALRSASPKRPMMAPKVTRPAIAPRRQAL